MRAPRTAGPAGTLLSALLPATLLAALLATLLAGATAAPAAAATPTGTGAGAESAAGWLTDQLVDGDHYTVTFDGTTYDDQGLTADGVFALTAAGGHDDAVAAMTDYLEAQAGAYTGTATGGAFAGSLAKLALVASVTGRDPHAFGGIDLLAQLSERMQGPGDPEPGRFSDAGADDYSTPISQALAVLALARAGQKVPDAAVDVLVGAACPDGGYPSAFPAPGSPCTSDPDATGFALTALAAVADTNEQATTAATAARDHLEQARRPDGSWDAEGAVNAAAVAASALHLVGADTGVTVDWLTGAQLADGSFPVAPGGDAGDVRATTQAVLPLAGASLLSVGEGGQDAVNLAGPTSDPTTAPTAAAAAPADSGGAGTWLVAALILAVLVLVLAAVLLTVRRRRGARDTGAQQA